MHRKNWLASTAVCFFSLVMLIVGSLPLRAQSFYGGITGTVMDSTGAVVPGATVTVINLGTNEKRQAQSGGAGEYRFVNLVPANYKVTVEAKAFKNFIVQPVVVQVDNTLRVDATLQPGAATETVEVTTQAPLLQTESGTVGNTVEGQQVQQMPLNGRNAMNLVALTPGVVATGYTAAGNQASFNAGNRSSIGSWGAYQIGGGFVGQNAQYVDGAPVNMLGNGVLAFIPTQDSVQEFKVSASAVSAEYGRFGGGVIVMTTKSGTNAFHGSAYEYFRNRNLNAKNFFLAPGAAKSPFDQNQYGAMFSGPVKKDKAFFFFNFEKYRLRAGYPQTGNNVPTAAQRGQADPLNQGNAIFNKTITDPSGTCLTKSGTGIIANYNGVTGQYAIPKACFDQATQVMMQVFPLPNNTTGGYNYYVAPIMGDDTTQYTARVDWNVSTRQQIFGRYYQSTMDDLGQNNFNNANGFYSTYAATHDHARQIVLGDTFTLNPTTIADARVSYTRVYFYNPALGVGHADMSKYGPAYVAAAPQMSYNIYPGMQFQGSNSIINTNPMTLVAYDHFDAYAVQGSLTKIWGKHTLKFGTEGTLRLHSGIGNTDHFAAGFSQFKGKIAGDDVAEFMLGEFDNDQIETTASTTSTNKAWGFYGTDTWKVTSRLTANLGLRWELPGGVGEKKDRHTVLLPTTADAAAGTSATIALVNSTTYPSRSIKPIHHNLFSPRVSFADSLTNTLVLRGGYALAWLPPDIPLADMSYQSPVNGNLQTVSNTTAAGVKYFQANPFVALPGGVIAPTYGRTVADPTTKFSGATSNQTLVVPTKNYPYMQQWDLALSKQWKGDWATEIDYVGAKGTKLVRNGAQGLDQIPDKYITGNGLSGTIGGTAFSNTNLQSVEDSLKAGGMTTAQAQGAINTYLKANPLVPYGTQFQNLLDGANFEGSVTYNALYLLLQKRFHSGGLINANFTWDKQLTDTDSPSGGNFNAGGTALVQDYNNTKAEKALGDQIVDKRLVVSYVLNLPFGKNQVLLANANPVVDHIVGGWTVNGIANVQGGFTLPFTYNGGNQLTGTTVNAGTIRPNVVAGCNKMQGVPKSTFQRYQQNAWFNAACFTYPGDYSFGNEPRVDPSLRGPGLTQFDLSLVKSTNIWENMNLQFRVETFNIFNHGNFINPNTAMGNGSYNKSTSGNNVFNPRLIQLSARLNF